jgi:HK97 family phage portal protein
MPGLLESILALPRRAKRARSVAGVHPSDGAAMLSMWNEGSSVAGVEVNEWQMLALSTVWTCVNSISADVAKLPMHLFRRMKPHGRERATEHTAYQILLSNPNPEMTALTFKQTLCQHALRWGNGYAELVADGAGRVREAWPLKPWRMRLMRTTAGDLVYVYTRDNGTPVPFSPDKIFHVRGMGEGVQGYSVVRYAMRSFGIAAAAEEHAAAVWENQAVPPVVLRHPGKLSPAAQEAVRKSWNELYAGKENAGKAAVLPEGMAVDKLAMTSDEAQFIESRKFSVADICRWYRFPPHMAGDLDRATFSNIEHMSLQYVTNCLMTWLEVFEQEADRKLLSEEERGDYYFEHITDALLRGDAKARSEATGKLLNDGVLTINEARDYYNFNPVAGELGRCPARSSEHRAD